MGQAEKVHDRTTIEAQASARYGSRGVPSDWFVDPADPEAAERYRQSTASSLEDQATAFLTAHEDLTDLDDESPSALLAPQRLTPAEAPAPSRQAAERSDQAVWIGLPGIGQDFDDEGELGWQADSLCAQTDPEAFFPEKGGSTRDAKKVCGACNVRSQCLEYALANDERFGIWGGLSERERRRLRKRAV
ncbi:MULTISPECIES: WhiB family transcriptional regulator [unclassified Arthrobacter]|uniref:WhiB family transcriptional regulator n=1 Tax=unclassified Arthrobacter TaxID=235627 RepID=UPI001490E94B|nr:MULTISPECIES: WhiB family transcriptional regulator [unclassified Arthrobacter]MBE0009025.1 WhiB family transcriptional regulator [Arthrobacter sp. AET 35A]NOJ60799.1 WhiB family transcriptional regulator [Arthrobacter sp. 260]NOJ62845.1 WhiB family transcriptional regulator [Arthrobacter sp. 147(2020)]